MKKIVSILVVLLFASPALAIDSPWEAKLPFKNGIIEYRLGGSMTGKKTTYVKDYGKTRAEYQNTTMALFGITQVQKEVILTTPDWVYTADLTQNTGTKNSNPQKYLIEEFHKLSKSDKKKLIKNVDKLGLSTIKGAEGTVERKGEKVMGYMCDKVSILGMVAHVFTGTDIELRVKGETMGITIDQQAVKVQKKKGPASKFELPANINFQYDPRMDQQLQQTAQATINDLLAGKAPKQTIPTSPQMPMGGNQGSDQGGMPQITPEMQEQMRQMMEMLNQQNQ